MEQIGTDGKIRTILMDHGITIGATEGLVNIESTIDEVMRGRRLGTHVEGDRPHVHPNKNGVGYIVHANAATMIAPDANDKRMTYTIKEALRAGADAVPIHVNVGSDHKPEQLGDLAELTKNAERYGLPVLAMTYARAPGVDEHDAESLAHAVRFARKSARTRQDSLQWERRELRTRRSRRPAVR